MGEDRPPAGAGSPIRIRTATADDVETLRTIYRAAVRAVGPAAYDGRQVEAWAAWADDPSFTGWITEAWTVLAVDGDSVVGFAGLDEARGRVTAVYVRPDMHARGVGGALLDTVLERAAACGIPTLRAEASEFSRRLFESRGFERVAVERVRRQGVEFERHLMERRST